MGITGPASRNAGLMSSPHAPRQTPMSDEQAIRYLLPDLSHEQQSLVIDGSRGGAIVVDCSPLSKVPTPTPNRQVFVHHIGGRVRRRSWCAWSVADPVVWSYGRTEAQARRRVAALIRPSRGGTGNTGPR